MPTPMPTDDTTEALSSSPSRVRDTSPEAERVLVQGYRDMPPGQKLRQVIELNRSVEQLAAARIRQQYGPELSDRELQLRLAALRLDPATMRRVFRWDPEIEGL